MGVLLALGRRRWALVTLAIGLIVEAALIVTIAIRISSQVTH
jgi:hypothetical protein